MNSTATNVRSIRTATETVSASDKWQGNLHRWFAPRQEEQMVAQQSKGLFIPYPLLAALLLVGGAVLSFVVAVQVQVSNLNQQVTNLNTTILMRDNDFRQQLHDSQEKNAQLEVYIHSDREKLVALETKLGIRRNQ